MFFDQLRFNFKITTGTLSNFLGIKTEQCHNGIFMCEHIYTEKQFKMHEANPVAMPCDHNSGGTEDSVRTHVPYLVARGGGGGAASHTY